MGIYKYNLANPAHCYYIAFKHYWPRLIATAGTWFLWDVAFYGNKLFRYARARQFSAVCIFCHIHC